MDIVKLSALEIREKILNKELSATQVVKAHLDRIDEIDKDINAFISINKEEALKAAEQVDEKIKNGEDLGSLAGIPIALKDNIVTRGTKTTCGSKMLEDFMSPYDARVVEMIKSQDGIIIGKTNMDEFAMGSSNERSYFGPTKNPVNTKLVPGGSSGGSAAAVKANEVPLALGTDTGGSIRQPAAYCDLVGIKPSYGLVSRYGVVPLANTLDAVGVFGKNVTDAALMLSAIAGYDEKDSTSYENSIDLVFEKGLEPIEYIKGMKIGIPKEIYLDEVDKRLKDHMDKVIKIFESLGASVEEISLPHLKYGLATYHVIATAEISSNMARFDGLRYGHRAKEYSSLDELYTNSRTEAFGDEVKRRILMGTYYLSMGHGRDYYEKALKMRTLIIDDFNKAFKDYDIILTPTSPILPFELGKLKDEPLTKDLTGIFTAPVNLAGLCAMSIPCGYIDGLPVGLQIIGDRFKENNIIKAGLGFEGGMKNGI
ncbi:MAG: Asp-tRNA(Asn)/Glu-tRNA(Gln) amidotransferase subunit GatA [Tissierellia bacterium]|nr:Asp-tRNA(Asn)/Glu-tRNA(Gln) amidotransferase subunit GatA [Tissierellia bacterium]